MSSILAYPHDTSRDRAVPETISLLIVSPNAKLRAISSRIWIRIAGLSPQRPAVPKPRDLGVWAGVAGAAGPRLPDLRTDDFKDLVHSQYPDVTIVPINPHTGRPVVTAPSPDSTIFEILRKLEGSAPSRAGNAGSPCDSKTTRRRSAASRASSARHLRYNDSVPCSDW